MERRTIATHAWRDREMLERSRSHVLVASPIVRIVRSRSRRKPSPLRRGQLAFARLLIPFRLPAPPLIVPRGPPRTIVA